MSSGKKTFVLLLLVVFLSFCISVISYEEERKITAVGKLSGGFRGGGGFRAGSTRGGGAGRPRHSGNGHGTRSGTILPALVAGRAGSAHATSNAAAAAAAIGHAQPTYISLATAILCFTILLFI